MDLKKDLGIDEVKVLPSAPPEGSKMVNSLTMEATVDVNPQPLLVLRPFFQAVKKIPPTLPAEAQVALQCLLACFEKKRTVSEGLIGDLIWGFQVSNVAANCTYVGLKQLAEHGYIKFQAKDNSWISITDDQAEGAWVRYQPKLLELVYE